MKKLLLAIFIVFNLSLIAGASFVLVNYVKNQTPRYAMLPKVPPIAMSNATSMGSAVTSSSTTLSGNAASTPALSGGGSTQAKIFSYRNSHAKHVAIRADFTGWKAEPMNRDSAGVWTYKAILAPGEYAYCYSVDDKPPLKDPVNKHTKVIGRAVVSAIVVEATTSKAPK